jgi:hypothetical protein
MSWRADVIRRGCTVDSNHGNRSSHIVAEAVSRIVRSCGVEHVLVKEDIDLAGAQRSKLPKHNVLRHTAAVVQVTSAGSL